MVQILPGTEVLDLGSATVLPGLFDGHITSSPADRELDEADVEEPLQYRDWRRWSTFSATCMWDSPPSDLKTLAVCTADVDLRMAINKDGSGPPFQVSDAASRQQEDSAQGVTRGDIPCLRCCRRSITHGKRARGVREQLMNGHGLIKFYAAYDFTFRPT